MTGEFVHDYLNIKLSPELLKIRDRIAAVYADSAKNSYRKRFLYAGVVTSDDDLEDRKSLLIKNLTQDPDAQPLIYKPELSCISDEFPEFLIIAHKYYRTLPVPELGEVTFVVRKG